MVVNLLWFQIVPMYQYVLERSVLPNLRLAVETVVRGRSRFETYYRL
jgi:hypothetical protein